MTTSSKKFTHTHTSTQKGYKFPEKSVIRPCKQANNRCGFGLKLIVGIENQAKLGHLSKFTPLYVSPFKGKDKFFTLLPNLNNHFWSNF